jgi:hypothetical protein
MSFTGNLLAESLRDELRVEGVGFHVHRIWRADAGDPSAGQPRTWTFIESEVPQASASDFAEALSGTLEPGPWYCDFRSDHETLSSSPVGCSGIHGAIGEHERRPSGTPGRSVSPSHRSTGPSSRSQGRGATRGLLLSGRVPSSRPDAPHTTMAGRSS